ncbi:hypothetical protein CHU98_g9615 [Xylaria longipes]|nr:hypothetical protein CHU98_g9615 [Xylaria longipes]
MCCKKNRTNAYGYDQDHGAGYLPHSYTQRASYNPTLYPPHAASRGRCCQRRSQERCHGGLFARLFGNIKEHRAQLGVENRDRPVVHQDESDMKGKRQLELGINGSDEYRRSVKRGESAQEEAVPPSYEAVMKSG